MIKIGLDVATNTGIAVIEVNDSHFAPVNVGEERPPQQLVRVLLIEHRELYFKHNVYEQVKAIKLLVNDICSMLKVDDKVMIALERSNYSKHCASIFGEICGMLVLEFISQLATQPYIMQFSPDEWHKYMYAGRLERKQWKELSLKTANNILPYDLTSDDESDAFNIAWYCHLCRNNVKIHEDVVERKQSKRNIEHELVKLYQKREYWKNQYEECINRLELEPNHAKSITTRCNKIKAKAQKIQEQIDILEKLRKGVNV